MTSLRFLSGLPLMVMAAALLVLGLQRVVPPPQAVQGQEWGALLIGEGRIDDAVAWYGAMATGGDAAALRRLASAADLAGQHGTRAAALQRLVRTGRATLAEHVEAARLLAWTGALPDALTVMFNAERRFASATDLRFLSFYAALARDCGRPEIALPLAQRMWKATGDEAVLRIVTELSGNEG